MRVKIRSKMEQRRSKIWTDKEGEEQLDAAEERAPPELDVIVVDIKVRGRFRSKMEERQSKIWTDKIEQGDLDAAAKNAPLWLLILGA